MIAICEPQCREISHEKVNSGFIYGLRLAYPDEKIIFYADIAHIKTIKDILIHDNIIIDNIEYIPIKFRDSLSITITGILTFYFLFKKMFSIVLTASTDKIFFLSFSPAILYVIKKLKYKRKFMKLKFTFVLHGDFENISDEKFKPTVSLIPKIIPNKTYINKIQETKLKDLPFKILRFIIGRINNYIIKFWQNILTKKFTTKEALLWKHSDDFRYIALSPHILVNAEKYIDTKRLNIYTVVLPMVFVEPIPLPRNRYPKFAIFGGGNSAMLQSVLLELAKKRIKTPYEIRIIGPDNRGTDGFPNITCISNGQNLTRSEMEKYAQDIDLFLILYESNRYRLSCSNSILESLSYMKPVLHFNNDCVNNFNKPDEPIGICCNTIEEFASTIEDIVENYQLYIQRFLTFRSNILHLRKKFAIENSITQIKKSFTW